MDETKDSTVPMRLRQNRLASLFETSEKVIANPALEEILGRTPANKFFVIFITPRSGSTFLTHALANTNRLGHPQEWFNYDSIGSTVRQFGISSVEQYFNFVIRKFSTPNRVFGVEFAWPQFDFLRELINVSEYFGTHPAWFFLRRRDVVAQAISLVVANQTGIWHSYQLLSGETNPTPHYDAKRIRSSMELIVNQEFRISQYLRSSRLAPVELYYEDIVENPTETIWLFGNVVKVTMSADTASVKNPISRLPKPDGYEFEERFRHECGDFLDNIRKRRLPLLVRCAAV